MSDIIPISCSGALLERAEQNPKYNNWIMGPFIEEAGLFQGKLEIKVRTAQAGDDYRSAWAPPRLEKTVVIMIYGDMEIEFEGDRTHRVQQALSYIIDDGSVRHRTTFHSETQFLVLRWSE